MSSGNLTALFVVHHRHTCGGKTSLEGNNSSSISCSTFLVYFLTHSRRGSPVIRRWCAIDRAIRPPYGGKPPYSCQVMSAIPQERQAILTALYRDTALIRQPYWGNPTVPELSINSCSCYCCVCCLVCPLAWSLFAYQYAVRPAGVHLSSHIPSIPA